MNEAAKAMKIQNITHKLTRATDKVAKSKSAHRYKQVHLAVKALMDAAAESDGVRSFNVWNSPIVDLGDASANDSRWS